MPSTLDTLDFLTRNTERFDTQRFREPEAIDRPVPFLSWNERMEPAELRRQVDLCKDAGWGGVFVHSRIGLTTPYLGEEWFAAAEATIDQCQKRGMKVWLYDEDKWPSGYSGGTVPLADPAYRLQTLCARPADAPAPEDVELFVETPDGLKIYAWRAPLGHDWFNGTCYTGLMHEQAMRKFLDDAYEPYFARFSELYGNTIVGQFTDEPCPIFRIRLPHGSVPFTPQLIERFTELHGYDPLPSLHLLWTDQPGAERFRIHYFRTVSALFEAHFTGQLAGWCEAHGIALTGHYMAEDNLYDQLSWAGTIMPNYRHQHIPGIDHLRRHIGNPLTAKQCQSVVNQYEKPRMLCELYGVSGGSLSFEDRLWIASEQISLGVNLLNPHLSLYTMTGCRKRDYPQNIFYQQPWWPLNKLIDEPLSRLCAALAQGRYAAELLVLHPMESAYAAWQSPMQPELSEGLVPWDHNPVTDASKARIQGLDRDFAGLIDTLLGAQRIFDLGDEQILADVATVEIVDGKAWLRVNAMRYAVVVLPSVISLATRTLELLEAFAAAGGRVLRAGEAPTLLEGQASESLNVFVASLPAVELGPLPDRLEALLPAQVTLRASAEDRRMAYVHIRDFEDGTRLVYLLNLHRMRAFNASACFAGGYRSATLLDFMTGKTAPLASRVEGDQLIVDLPFAPTQTHLLLLSPTAHAGASPAISLIPAPIVQTLPLAPQAWSVERLDDNALTLDCAFWRIGTAEWSAAAIPVIGLQQYLNSVKYDGPLALRYPFQVGTLEPGRKLCLVVEYPERMTIRINGVKVEYSGLPAWRDFRWMPIDIAPYLRPGENTLELGYATFQHGDLTCVEDSFARYGTEIESVYLVGDFSVSGAALAEKPVAAHWAEQGLPPIAVQCFAAESFALEQPAALRAGDTTLQGLPFYAGRLRLAADLPKLTGGGSWRLRIDKLDAPVAEVALDGAIVGHFLAHPLEVEITPDARRVEITLYSTLRNLLGPHHNPEGESAAVGPHSFHPISSFSVTGPVDWALRLAQGETQEDWNERYCMTTLGELGRVELIRRDA